MDDTTDKNSVQLLGRYAVSREKAIGLSVAGLALGSLLIAIWVDMMTPATRCTGSLDCWTVNRSNFEHVFGVICALLGASIVLTAIITGLRALFRARWWIAGLALVSLVGAVLVFNARPRQASTGYRELPPGFVLDPPPPRSGR